MDFLGLFDGLFTTFSAMRSGKGIDKSEIKSNKASQNNVNQLATQADNQSIKSRQTQINSSRTGSTQTKNNRNDRDMN